MPCAYANNANVQTVGKKRTQQQDGDTSAENKTKLTKKQNKCKQHRIERPHSVSTEY